MKRKMKRILAATFATALLIQSMSVYAQTDIESVDQPEVTVETAETEMQESEPAYDSDITEFGNDENNLETESAEPGADTGSDEFVSDDTDADTAADPEFVEETDIYNYNYISNDDGTHTVICTDDDCEAEEKTEDCDYDEETGICVKCGYEKPVEAEESEENPDQKETFAVTFFVSDETMEEYELYTVDVAVNSVMDVDIIPMVPEVDGYTFTGWDNDINAEIIEDTEFHALYEEIIEDAEEQETEEDEIEVTVSDIDDDVLTEANELVSNAYADYVVAGAFDLSVPEDTEFPVTITFDADVTVSDTVMILHYTGELWEEISPESVEDGSVTATFNSLSPVVVLKYEETESAEPVFCEKRLVQTVNGICITVTGEMPEDAWLKVTTMEPTEKVIDGKAAIASYDITILYADEQEYEPAEFGKEIHVSFSNVSTLALGEVAVQHNTESGFEEMGTKEVTEGNDTISFNTDSFSEYILTTATLTMTRGADYVSIPIVGKTGYIYHMELDGYTAFCIELGKHASSNDKYYYTDIFSNANALKVLDVFENGSSLTYESAQALVWLAIEGDFTDANITTVLQSLQCSDSNIATVLSDLANASGADTWYVYTSVQGSEYQKVVTKFYNEVESVEPSADPTTPEGIYIKVFLDGYATDAYPVVVKTYEGTETSTLGGSPTDGTITPVSLGNGLYQVTFEQLENANLLSDPYISNNNLADTRLIPELGFTIAGKTVGNFKSEYTGFKPISEYYEAKEKINSLINATSVSDNLYYPKTVTNDPCFYTLYEKNTYRYLSGYQDYEDKAYTLVFPIFLSSLTIRDKNTDALLLDAGVIPRSVLAETYDSEQSFCQTYVFNKSTMNYNGNSEKGGFVCFAQADVQQYATDLGIDLSPLPADIQSAINSRYFNIQDSILNYPADMETNALTTSNKFFAPITHYISGAVTTHTVTFDVNGGTPEYGSVQVAHGEKVTKPLTVPLKTGNTFVSWQLNGTDYDFNTPVTQDITLVAKYGTVGYNITYDLDGGEMPTGATNPTYYNVTTPTFTLNNPVKTGYTFKGWTGSNGTTPQTWVTVTQGTTGNLNYTANWEINQYTVKFEDDNAVSSDRSDGLFPKTVTVDYGSAVTYPADWVTHYNNGDNFDVENTVAHKYYKFKGWQNKDTGEYIAETDIAHPSASGITSSSYAVTGNVTYVAMYDTYYGVVFTDGTSKIAPATVATPDNTIVSGNNYYYKSGAVIDQPGNTYTSAYWAKGNYPANISDITAEIPLNLTKHGNTITMGSSPVSYIAYYSMRFYNDDYVDSANRGTLVTEIFNVKDRIVTPPADPTTTVTNSTDIFDKWVLKEADDLNGTTFKQQGCSMVYVAAYKPAPTYDVVFVDYDGTEIDRQVCHMSDPVTIPASPTRDSYRFMGWTPTVVLTCNGNATYTATYAELFIVKFVDYDGTVITEREYEAGNTVVVPASPTRDGYTFAGWTPTVNSTCNGNATYTATYTVAPEPTATPSQAPENTPDPTPDVPIVPEPTATPTPTMTPSPTPTATPSATPKVEKPKDTPEPDEKEDKPTAAPTMKPAATPEVTPEAVVQKEKTADLEKELPTERVKKYDIEKFIAAVVGIAAATGFSLWALLMLLLFLFRKKNKVIGLYETDGKVTYVNSKGHRIKAEDLDDVQTVQELAEKVNAGEMSAEEFLEALYEYDVWTVFPPHTVAGVTIGEDSITMPKMNNSEVKNVYENISGDTTVNISNPNKGIDIEFMLK